MTTIHTLLKIKILRRTTPVHLQIWATPTAAHLICQQMPKIVIETKPKQPQRLANPQLPPTIPHILFLLIKQINTWDTPCVIISMHNYQLLQLHWLQFLGKLLKSNRAIYILKLFKINIYDILQILLAMTFKHQLKIWQHLAIQLYRIKPTRQRYLILNFFRLIIFLFKILKPFTKIAGYFIKIRGKINRAGSVRKKQIKFMHGQRAPFSSELTFNKQFLVLRTPAGALGLTIYVYYKVIYVTYD